MSLMASFSGKLYGMRSKRNRKKTKEITMDKKRYTLDELEEMVGSKELDRLFIEHCLTKVGVDKEHFEIDDDDSIIGDIMK